MKRFEVVVVMLLASLLCVSAIAQETESTMNLSYPARFYGTSLQSGTAGSHSLGGLLGTSMSWGCLLPETVGTTTYPNTSCRNPDTGVYLDQAACTTMCYDLLNPPGTVDPVTPLVERIFWQRDSINKWQGGYELSETALPVEYVDWGDNLESKSWPVQVIRVETNTFSSLVDPNAMYRFVMWHVIGQGTTELWGVRTDATNPEPYVYLDSTGSIPNWAYGVNVVPDARLNLAKLDAGAVCPTSYIPSPYLTTVTEFVKGTDGTQSKWTGAKFTEDLLYGAELNIKGSYVYGYNWNLRSMTTGGVEKTGWWRLTFYTPNDTINFNAFVDGTTAFAPPPEDPAISDPGTITESGTVSAQAEADTGALYRPVVDKTNNVTFIDICIAKEKGSGKKGPR